MSQENVEIVRNLAERFAEGDLESWRVVVAEDVVWDTSATNHPLAGVYEGHSEVERFFADWLGTWENPVYETVDLIDAGDSVVVAFRWSGRGRTRGIATEMELFGVHDLEEGRVVRFRQYGTMDEALEAAGLSA